MLGFPENGFKPNKFSFNNTCVQLIFVHTTSMDKIDNCWLKYKSYNENNNNKPEDRTLRISHKFEITKNRLKNNWQK